MTWVVLFARDSIFDTMSHRLLDPGLLRKFIGNQHLRTSSSKRLTPISSILVEISSTQE